MARRYVRDNRGRFARVGATARGGRLRTASGGKRAAQINVVAGGAPKGTIGKPKGSKPGLIKPKAVERAAPKADLSRAAFERRASSAEKRATAAERAIAGADRGYAHNRRAFRRADALRSAADSYKSIVRKSGSAAEFSAADVFNARFRYSTAPKLSRAEKAAATRRAKAEKQYRENVRLMERRRRG